MQYTENIIKSTKKQDSKVYTLLDLGTDHHVHRSAAVGQSFKINFIPHALNEK